MRFTLTNFFEFVLPTHPDVTRAKRVVTGERTLAYCRTKRQAAVTLSAFADPDVRACIHALKFRSYQAAAMPLGDLLVRYLRDLPRPLCVVPIPLSTMRQRERGYNQVTLMANYAATHGDVIMVREMLKRTRHTAPQTSVTKEEREANVAEAFGLCDPAAAARHLQNHHVILLDDVLTTGATMDAAKAALSPLPLRSLTAVAIAH